MDGRIATILKSIAPDEMAQIASGALGISVSDAGPLTYTEITTPHAEDRTVGIVKVAGQSPRGSWSSVVKVLDMSVAPVPRFAGVTQPETEELVRARLSVRANRRASHGAVLPDLAARSVDQAAVARRPDGSNCPAFRVRPVARNGSAFRCLERGLGGAPAGLRLPAAAQCFRASVQGLDRADEAAAVR